MKKSSRVFILPFAMIAAFILWTALVRTVDVQPIGPLGSFVGLAGINGWVHDLTGVHFALYTITDWMGLVPVACCLGFALFGLGQWIKRRHILNVDFNILALGGFYIVVMAAYLYFESHVINFRPVLINGYLEASYPSSTTLLVLCVMPTVMMQLNTRIKNEVFRKCLSGIISAFMLFMIIGRLISGVHWLSDIIGGILLSAGLVMLYRAITEQKTEC